MFSVYVAVSVVPMVALAGVLIGLLHSQGQAEGLAEGRSKADLLASAGVTPLLGDEPVNLSVPADRRAALRLMISGALEDRSVLRIRLWDGRSRLVLQGERTGPGNPVEATSTVHVNPDVIEAARGQDSARLVRSHVGPPASGAEVVAVFTALTGSHGRSLGVLEVDVPYAPLAAEIARRQRVVGIGLGAGLLLLWLCLSAVSISLSRRMRRQAVMNAYLATRDTLTGLPNRVRFADRVSHAVAGAYDDALVAVAVIDLDRFREVNDTLGHRTGDDLIVRLAARIEEYCYPGATAARLGGDEFGIVVRNVASAQEALTFLTALRALIAEPAVINEVPMAVEASIGLVLAPHDGVNVDILLQRADLAMCCAKRQRSGIVRWAADLEQDTSSAPMLVAELRAGLSRDELVLHYQPKSDIRTGRVTGFEALVRWQHPSRGLLYPDSFLPAAEQTEVIDELTWWVVRRACADLRDLDASGQLSMAVNVSARSLIRPDFAADLFEVLDSCDADPARLVLEITETAVLTDPVRASAALHQLHRAGLRISIDDFGAGQTSLGYLARLPITELKIDKSFVLNMQDDDRNAAIVRSLIELGHALDLTVTAEGVETLPMLELLMHYGCDTAQGYLLARPVPVREVPSQMSEAGAVLEAVRPSRHLSITASTG